MHAQLWIASAAHNIEHPGRVTRIYLQFDQQVLLLLSKDVTKRYCEDAIVVGDTECSVNVSYGHACLQTVTCNDSSQVSSLICVAWVPIWRQCLVMVICIPGCTLQHTR